MCIAMRAGRSRTNGVATKTEAQGLSGFGAYGCKMKPRPIITQPRTRKIIPPNALMAYQLLSDANAFLVLMP